MKKLKTILQSKWLYMLLIIIASLNFIIAYCKVEENILEKEGKITGIVDKIENNDNNYHIELVSKERVMVFYTHKKDQKNLKLNLGDTIEIKGEISSPENNRNFNLFNYRKYLLSKKIKKTMKANYIINKKEKVKLKYKAKKVVNKRIDKLKSKSYLKAYITGSTKGLNERIAKSFVKNGISHLFAVSGDSISLFVLILVKILERIFKSKKKIYFICFSFLFFYMFLTDYSPAVVRASIFFMMLIINKSLKLNISTSKVFMLLFCMVFIFNPFYIYNSGFVFSYLVSFTLICTSDLINKYKNYFLKLFFISTLSFTISLPIVINNYFEFNLLSPFFNLFFVPIIVFIIFPLSIITFIFPFFDPLLFLFSEIFNNLSLLFSRFSINIVCPKMNMFYMLIYYLLFYFTIKEFKKNKIIYHLFIFFILYLLLSTIRLNDTFTMIDIGQGDSSLLELKTGENILIDTGGKLSFDGKHDYDISDNIVLPYLRSRGIRKLDLLILTHGDTDHMGESINIVNKIKVKKVLMNAGSNNTLEMKLIEVLKMKKINYKNITKEKLKIGNINLEFLNNKNIENENEDSLIIYTKINDYNILLMGDAGISSEKDLIEEYNLPNMDILKIGHHGSRHSTSKEFIDKVKPKFSLISAGKNNRYGHPHKEVIDNLKKHTILNTKTDGMVKIVLTKKMEYKMCLEGR